MQFYLETNALRALGSEIEKNNEVLEKSYTSIFSLFEISKGIGRSTDSDKRKKILMKLKKVELKFIELMPLEMIETAFVDTIDTTESEHIHKTIASNMAGNSISANAFNEIARQYESNTKIFQSKITELYATPEPEPEKITMNLEIMFSDPSPSDISALEKLPKDAHPSRVAMEYFKREDAPLFYRAVTGNYSLGNEEIMEMYNNSLDLFFFAYRSFNLKRRCLREAAAKNDWLDILHTTYLRSYDDIIVSDDKIFETILPNINIMSVMEFKDLMKQ